MIIDTGYTIIKGVYGEGTVGNKANQPRKNGTYKNLCKKMNNNGSAVDLRGL